MREGAKGGASATLRRQPVGKQTTDLGRYCSSLASPRSEHSHTKAMSFSSKEMRRQGERTDHGFD
jgi:hypothetical protein